MFAIAILLLLASAGIVVTTVARRSAATAADQSPPPEPTPFVAIVETPYPTPVTPTPSPTPSTAATPRAATPTTGTNRTPTAVAAAVLGSGQSKAARGLAGAMAIALGGSLPPAAAAPPVGGVVIPPSNPTPTPVPTPILFPIGGSTGGGSTGGGNTGGGNTGGGFIPPTPTRIPTPIPPPPTATALPTATPTPAVPALPPVALPGPGSGTHRYDLTYVQAADLAQAPADDTAYIVQWVSFTQAQFAGIAKAWGITAPVQATGDGFRASDAQGTLVVNSTTGQIIYTAPAAASAQLAALASPTIEATGTTRPGPSAASPTVPPSAAPAPSPTAVPTSRATPAAPLTDAQALRLAGEWLAQAGLLPPDARPGTVARPTTDQIVVTFRPKLPENPILGDPAITVRFGASGPVREVYYRWARNPNPRLARLRDAAEAWAEAAAGNGYLEVDQTVPANLPANTVYRGTATVTKVTIGLRNATSGSGTNYLVPIFIFEGTVALDNPAPGQSGPFAFRLYIQATP